MGVYKRLECSQSIFEQPKRSVCFISSVPCLSYFRNLFRVENCTRAIWKVPSMASQLQDAVIKDINDTFLETRIQLLHDGLLTF